MSSNRSIRSLRSADSSSVSEIAAQFDSNPVVTPVIEDFVEMFDDKDLDELFEQFEDSDLFIDELALDEIGGQDFIDIMEAFEMDKPENDNSRPKIESFRPMEYSTVPSGRRILSPIILNETDIGPFTIRSNVENMQIMLEGTDKIQPIGYMRKKADFVINIKPEDYYETANRYAEEVGGKGVNLGFSSFLHSVVIMILARNTNGVIEPFEGQDYAFDGYLVEVTGQKYKERITDADFVINKYLVVSAMLSTMPNHKEYVDLSWSEDTGKMNHFYDTAFDNTETKRSPIMRDIAYKISQITSEQRRSLGKNYIAYCFKQGIPDTEIHKSNRDFTETQRKIESLIQHGAKEKDGSLMVPSPFRVLYPQDEEILLTRDETERRQNLQVFTTDWGPSTYHTWHINKDPRNILRSTIQRYPEEQRNIHCSLHDAISLSLRKYRSYTYATIQAALLPKINGKGGCFYDKYNRVGITWWRKNASSLTWFCNYYTFNSPGAVEEVGNWHYDTVKGVYIGPTFLVSRQDIHYASILPVKVSSALSAIRTLIDPSLYRDTEEKVIMAMGIQNDSTWMTSHRCDANRFLTCCHVSASGDLPALIEGQLKDSNTHRFCDFFQLKLFEYFIKEDVPTNRTPLLRLPFAILSYEKDFSQTLQWHMRDTNHSTECMRKISEATKREIDNYEEYTNWMAVQNETLDKMLNNGLSAEDYGKFMTMTPSFPHLNILAFIGMTNIVSDELNKLGGVQHAVGLSIWSLITDRHCIEYKGKKGNLHVVKSSRVVEAMYNMLRKHGKLTGIYELIVRMANGSKLPPNLLLNHYKDAKGSDREISQMMPEHRVKQAIPEALTETFTGNHEDDMMSDPAKYNKHVAATMDSSTKGKAMHGSEDRSKFCHEQDPQSQGICLGIISNEVGSTCLRTAAAMTMMNKTRDVVYPHDADFGSLLQEIPNETMLIESSMNKSLTKKISMEKTVPEDMTSTQKITIEKNMTQGLGAITAGAINTIFVQSHAKIFDMMVPGFRTIAANTTSDDVKRSGSNDSIYDHEQVFKLYREIPNRNIHMCMMRENMKKPIFSRTLSEFNNVVATTSGMVSQAPVFATLTVQPLLSKSLFGDIATVVNTTRSTLTWGCPPDTIQSSMYSMLRVFQQKWLITEEEMNTIWLAGLLPRDINEHIEGFWIRNREMLKKLMTFVPVEMRETIGNGTIPIYDVLKRVELDLGKKRKKKRMEIKDIEGLHRANKVKDTILSQRLVAESLMTRHIVPIHPQVRINAKRAFFRMLATDEKVDDVSYIERMRPQRVSYTVRAARQVDRQPCSLGTSSQLPEHSLQRLRAAKYLGVNYRNYLSEEEQRIMAMSDEDFENQLLYLERAPRFQGFSFKSPVGKPFTRIFDNKIMKRPAVFDFDVDLEQIPTLQQPFTYKGVPVLKFKPIFFGGNMLQRIKSSYNKKIDVLAFGHGFVNKQHTLFFKKRSDHSSVMTLSLNATKSSTTLCTRNYKSLRIHYTLRFDNTPIPAYMHKNNIIARLPGVMGDDTAIQNYGNYCRSSSPDGFRIYQAVYDEFGSVLPSHVINNMPSYPYFMGNYVEISRGRNTNLHGYFSATRLKLLPNTADKELVEIDLTSTVPVEKENEFEEDVYDLEYESGSDSL